MGEGKHETDSVILVATLTALKGVLGKTCELHKKCTSEKSNNKAEVFLYCHYFLLLEIFPKLCGWDVQYLFVDEMIA